MEGNRDYLFVLNERSDSYESINTQIFYCGFRLRFGPALDLSNGRYDRKAEGVVGVYLLNKPEGVVNSPDFKGKHVSLEDALSQAFKHCKK